MELFQGPGLLPEGLESFCIHGDLKDWSLCRATEPHQDPGVPPGGRSPSQGCGALLRTWIPSQEGKPFQDMVSFLRKWSPSLGNCVSRSSSSSATLASVFLPRGSFCAGLCWKGGLQDGWGRAWGWSGWHPDLMQVESTVSPMKSLLVLHCLLSWGQEWGGRGKEGP